MSKDHKLPKQNPFDPPAAPEAFVAPTRFRFLRVRPHLMTPLPCLFSTRPWRSARRAFIALVTAAALVPCAVPGAAEAHHSFAMYDQTKIVTLNGTVKDFQWSNPHALVWLLVPATAGDPVLWSIELPTGPGNLARQGWSKHSLNAGDKVAVDINPLRDGRNGGSLKKATLVDSGKILVVGPVAGAKP